jgi:hypothetical protein
MTFTSTLHNSLRHSSVSVVPDVLAAIGLCTQRPDSLRNCTFNTASAYYPPFDSPLNSDHP